METRLTEIELLEKAQDDLEAFGELVERYRNSITRQCFSRVKDRDHAEDLAQETFVRAYMKLDQLKRLDLFPNWLRKIASNVCSEFTRSPSRREWAWEILPDALSSRNDPVDIHVVLDALPELTRQCVELFYGRQMSLQEVSEATGLTVPSVRGRLQRAKAVLRQEMTDVNPPEKSAFTRQVLEKIEQLKSSDSAERVEAARDFHTTLAEDRVEWILGLLRHENPLERTAAVKPSRKYRSPRVRDALVDLLLHDEWEEIRMKAANSLVAQGDPSVIPYLKQAMEDESNPKEVIAAAKSAIVQLEKLEVPSDVEKTALKLRRDVEIAAEDKKSRVELLRSLKAALKDPKPEVREHAVKALQELNDKRAVPAIAELLEDSVIGIRKSAANALGEIGSPQAVPALTRALRDSNDRMLLQAIVLAISKIGDPKALPDMLRAIVDKYPMWRGNGMLYTMCAGFVEAHAVADELPLVRKTLDELQAIIPEGSYGYGWTDHYWINILSAAGDQRYVPVMIDLLRQNPGNEKLIEGLGRIGDPRTIDVLRESLSYLGHPRRTPLRSAEIAAVALTKLGEPGLQVLTESLSEEKPNVQMASLHGLLHVPKEQWPMDKLRDIAESAPGSGLRFQAKVMLRKARK